MTTNKRKQSNKHFITLSLSLYIKTRIKLLMKAKHKNNTGTTNKKVTLKH